MRLIREVQVKQIGICNDYTGWWWEGGSFDECYREVKQNRGWLGDQYNRNKKFILVADGLIDWEEN